MPMIGCCRVCGEDFDASTHSEDDLCQNCRRPSQMDAADSLAHGVRELLDEKWPGQDLGSHLIKLHFLVERYEKKRRRQPREATTDE